MIRVVPPTNGSRLFYSRRLQVSTQVAHFWCLSILARYCNSLQRIQAAAAECAR